jgi:hypothetical protein
MEVGHGESGFATRLKLAQRRNSRSGLQSRSPYWAKKKLAEASF